MVQSSKPQPTFIERNEPLASDDEVIQHRVFAVQEDDAKLLGR